MAVFHYIFSVSHWRCNSVGCVLYFFFACFILPFLQKRLQVLLLLVWSVYLFTEFFFLLCISYCRCCVVVVSQNQVPRLRKERKTYHKPNDTQQNFTLLHWEQMIDKTICSKKRSISKPSVSKRSRRERVYEHKMSSLRVNSSNLEPPSAVWITWNNKNQ